jgi:hypothetical protein
MSKKLFNKLIKRASTPVPADQDKQLNPAGYSGKQTHSRKAGDTSVKPSNNAINRTLLLIPKALQSG